MNNTKNILITLFYANGLHGGVKYSAEIGNYFHSIGYNVYCIGVVTDDFTIDFMKQNNVSLINIKNFDNSIKYDLVWAHHFPILPYLIRKGLKYDRIINSCISSILLIEKPIYFYKNIDLILILTDAVKETFINDYKIPLSKIRVLPNTAPDSFFDNVRKNLPQKIKSVAVVSNHCPKEVIDALKILKKSKIKTIIYGGKNPVNITPDVLKKHDVIISIGKTVQYALAMKIPVYNYDHFGGNGYITPENINNEQKYVFSGRSTFKKKSANEIANEILSQYKTVIKKVDSLYNIAVDRFKLSKQIQKILNIISQSEKLPLIQENPSNKLIFDYCEFIIDNNAKHKRIKRKKFWGLF